MNKMLEPPPHLQTRLMKIDEDIRRWMLSMCIEIEELRSKLNRRERAKYVARTLFRHMLSHADTRLYLCEVLSEEYPWLHKKGK